MTQKKQVLCDLQVLFSDIQLSNSRAGEVVLFYFPEHSIAEKREKYKETAFCVIIPSLTVAEIKNRCIPCVYWGTAIFVVVMKYSNLFFSFAFFLDRSHFAFGYELIISSEAAGFMKIICNGFTLI